VADWWLGMATVLEVEAAAAPATTTNRAKMRMASFIFGNPLRIGLAEVAYTARNNCIDKSLISPVFSYI
jgi:hypothetical protein